MQITKARLKQIIKEELDASKRTEQINEVADLSDAALTLMSWLNTVADLSPSIIGGALGLYIQDRQNKAREAKKRALSMTPAQYKDMYDKVSDAEKKVIDNFAKTINGSSGPVNEMIDLAGISGIDPNTLGTGPLLALATAQLGMNLAPGAVLGGLAAYIMRVAKMNKKKVNDGQAKAAAKKIVDAAEQQAERAKRDAEEISSDLGAKRQPKK